MKLVTVEQMRRIEQLSDAAGHSYAAMMERAGTAVAVAIESRMVVKNKRILVLVGPGNNGGDGLVAARALREADAEVSCYLFRDRPQDPLLIAVGEQGCFVAVAPDDLQLRVLRRLVKGAHVIVDALLGTGTARPIEGDLAKILDIVKSQVQAKKGPATSGLVEIVAVLTRTMTRARSTRRRFRQMSL
jgi:NAD(P)H-hydrate epimerase